MANEIIETNIRPIDGLVEATSRYANSSVIYYGDKHKMTYKTYVKNKYPISKSDRYTVVDPGQEFRPDLVSNLAYNTPNLWWKIMEANNIKDIYEFRIGLNLRLPGNIF